MPPSPVFMGAGGEGGSVRLMSQIDARAIARDHGTGEDAQRCGGRDPAGLQTCALSVRGARKNGTLSYWGAIFPFAMANYGCSTKRTISSVLSKQLPLSC
jgi:hypothetical protein